jgi:hydroxymethylglutaryl-CoA reductase (NADPH)
MSEDFRIPRSPDNDYSAEWATKRREFLEQKTGANLTHTGQYSIGEAGRDPNFLIYQNAY